MIDGAGAGADAGTVWGVAFLRPHGVETAMEDCGAAGLSVFWPRVKTLEVRRRRRKVLVETAVTAPLFRGYLFVGWVAGSGDWALATQARGVLDLIRSCGKQSSPSIVPAEVMGGLLAAGELIDLTLQQQAGAGEDFGVGDVVSVVKDGFEGQIFRIAGLDPKRRIRFLLTSMKPGFERFELRASAGDLKKVAA